MNYVSGVFKRFAALTMAVMMLAGLCPGVFLEVQVAKAANQDVCIEEEQQTDDKAGAGEILYQGDCGEQVFWKFTEETGELEISGNGAMYDYEAIGDLPWYQLRYDDKIKKVVVKSGVTRIGKQAFRSMANRYSYYKDSLEEINIADTVTEIGDYAFYYCSVLKTAVIPDSVKKIGVGAFALCVELESAALGSGVEIISTGAFCGSGLKTVVLPDSLASLGEEEVETNLLSLNKGNVFSDCKKLESAVLPSGLEKIEEFMFQNCQVLREVTIPDSVKFIGDLAFYNCRALQSVGLASVEIIGDNVFGQTALQEVTIPGTVISLGEIVFSGCRELSSVTLEDGLTSLGLGLFENCTSLKDITIPDSVVSIFSDTQKDGRTMSPFSGCTGLETVRLSKNLEEIPANLFAGCVSLNEIQIPEKVRIVGNRAFSGCTGLKKVDFMGSAPKFSVPEGSLEESRAFQDVEAVVRYPGDDTWTPEVQKDYGGTLQWEQKPPELEQNLEVTPDRLEITVNQSVDITVTGAHGEISYQSSNEKVAVVGSGGQITGCSVGTAQITVSASGGGMYLPASRTVEVTVEKGDQNLIVKPEKLELTVNGKASLTVTGAHGAVRYISKNTDVAMVSSRGEVVALSAGTAWITVEAAGSTDYHPGSSFVEVIVTDEEEPPKPIEPEEPDQPEKPTEPEEPEESSPSPTIPKPDQIVVPAVAGISVKASSYDAIKINWKPAEGVDGYVLYRSLKKNSGYQEIARIKKPATAVYTDKGLKNTIVCYYKMAAYRASDGKNYEGPVSKVYSAKPKKLAAPSSLRLQAGKKAITVKFKKVKDAAGYEIYRASKKNGKYKKAATVKKTVFKDKKLKSRTAYYYKVRAYRKMGKSKIYSNYTSVLKKKTK